MRAKILSASAGSGKTYQLAYKYVRDVVEVPARYRHILAVTFTNKATEEMKSRILERIHELAAGEDSPYLENLCRELRLDVPEVRKRASDVQSKILHDYSHFTILTIDKFFQRILRAFIRELGIAPDYNTEIETESIVERSADILIEQITSDNDLRRWLLEFVEERIAQGRRWDIREGILSLSSELFKEQNRTSLSISLSKETLHKLISDIASKAQATKDEMCAIAQQAVNIALDNGLILEDFPHKDKGFAAYIYKIAFGEIEPYGKRVSDARNDISMWGKMGSASYNMYGQLSPLLREICKIYDDNICSWNTAALLHENYRSFALLADLYGKVQQMCNQENMMLLSETKYLLSEFIGHNNAPFIYEKAGNRYDSFMIDEFQDTSMREWENFLPLLENAMAQSEQSSVLLVGDIKQSIYRWRGGDWRILHSQARNALGSESTEVEALRENYRSLSTVVEFNNTIIGAVVQRDNLELNVMLSQAIDGSAISAPLSALRDTLTGAYHDHEQIAARRSDREGFVRVAIYEEEPPVVKYICEILDRGFLPRDILILVRTNNEGVRIAETLLEFKQQNRDPRYRFDVMTQEALTIGNAPICSFMTAALSLCVAPTNQMARATFNAYLGRAFNTPSDDEELTFFRSVRLLSPEEAFEHIVMRYKLDQQHDQTAYLQAIHEAIILFCSRKVADIPLFLKWWDEKGRGQSLSVEQNDYSIGIMTIHKAKGLQSKVVIIPFCSWSLAPEAGRQPVVWSDARGEQLSDIGRFPVRYKKNMATSYFSVEYYQELIYTHVDNINLLYVALTRAEESLYILIPQRARTKEHVGSLILNALRVDEGLRTMIENRGRCTETEANKIYEFGEATPPATHKPIDSQIEHVILDTYSTSKTHMRLRLPSQRYFEDGGDAELAPRNIGIMMHKAFERATTIDDIRSAIESMSANSEIGGAEAEYLRASIDKALTNTIVQEWFSDKWDSVRNENEIIVPRDSHIRRPDRVMICGPRAVVVDYKFGDRESTQYRRQIGEYTDLLRSIGHTQTEGYIWYVKLGTIEKVV